MLGIEANSWYTSFTRWMRSDERALTLRRIGELVDESTKIINDTSEQESKRKLKLRVKTKLRSSILGLRNLGTTYEDDIATRSHIDHIIEDIENIVGKYIDNDNDTAVNSSVDNDTSHGVGNETPNETFRNVMDPWKPPTHH